MPSPKKFSEGHNMKNKATQVGFGLIEVLVTLLIVSIGLLVIAKFQSSVTSESRFNKTRSEAQALCEDALTPYRQPLTFSEFNALSDVTNATFTGTTETITLNLNVVNTAAATKELTATCTWGNTPATADRTIQLTTEVSSNSLTLAALSAGAGESGVDGLSPSLNAGASDEISERIRLIDDQGDRIKDDGDAFVSSTAGESFIKNDQVYVIDDSGNTGSKAFLCSIVDVAQGSIGTRGYTIDASNNDSTVPIDFETFKARRLKDGSGSVTGEIELFEPVTLNVGAGDQEFCIPRVRYNGGVIIPIRGTISSGVLDNQGNVVQFNLFTFDISESGTYCVLDQSDPNATSVPYSCYVGGNCTNGPAGNNDNDFFQCPSIIPSVINIDGPGGWRGRIGVLGLAELGYGTCYFDEVKTETDGTRDTARNYYSRYSVSAAIPSAPSGFADVDEYLSSFDKNQGLNQPQICHDFLIIDAPNSPQYSQFRTACRAAEIAVGGINLASKNIQRDIVVGGTYTADGLIPATSENAANVFDPTVNQTWCSLNSYSLSVIASGAYVGIPEIRLNNSLISSEYVCDYNLNPSNVLTSYSCNFEAPAGSITVSGNQGSSFTASAPCDLPLTLNSDGTFSDTSSSAVSSCTVNFSVPPLADGYTLFDVTGVVTADSGLGAEKGIEKLDLVLNDSQTLGCTISQTASSASNSYRCDFYAKTADSAVLVPRKTSSGYTVDAANFDGTVNLSAGVTSIAGPDIPLTATVLTTPYTVSGTLNIANNIEVDPTISSEGDFAVCSFNNPPTTPAGWSNSSTEYSCIVDSGQNTTITFAISPGCSTGINSRAFYVSVDNGPNVQGLNTYSATGNATGIDVDVSRGNPNTCQ